jgi:hypothetical protein
MNIYSIRAAVRHGAPKNFLGLAVAMALPFLHQSASANPVMVQLGTASSFGVLAGSGITVAGAVNTTTITGNIGTSPTPAITGLGNVVLNGVNDANNAVTAQAKIDLSTAFTDAANRPSNVSYGVGYDFVGQTLVAGVYSGASSLALSGTLTLDAQGNPDSVFIFQAGSTLTTASASKIILIGGAQACHVFWEVGSSATLGTGSDFMGSILALTSITLNTGATLEGRALALNGAVTLDNNTITVPICNSATSVPDGGNTLPMLGLVFGGLFILRQRYGCIA